MSEIESSENTPAERADAPAESTFDAFGLSAKVMRGVEEAGFKVASPIQTQAIPQVMEGRDLVGQAHTGTGKTAAFGLPALSKLRGTGKVEVLIITPTRELATQVSEEVYRLGQFVPVHTLAIYGGQPYGRQLDSLKRGAQVVVATPGRLLDLLDNKRVQEIVQPWLVVLDEADEMLDMGFLDDIKKIFALLPEDRQTVLFSATMPKPIEELTQQFLKDPVRIRIDHKEATNRDIQQQYYVIDEHERDDATTRLMDSMEPERSIVFCRTKKEVDRVAGILSARGFMAQALHGDMEQPMRERVINGFRNGDFQTLVATDVAARGLDVPEVTHVFNYHIPFDTESYVHRIGRTGRAGRKGVAVTLVTPREYQGLRRIQHRVGQLQNRLIPSHHEIKRATEEKMLEQIRSQEVNSDAARFVTALGEELGLDQAAHKMAALLLEQDGVTGPDRIGVQGARLEKLTQKPKPAKPGTGGYKGAKPGGFKPGGYKGAGFKSGGYKGSADRGDDAKPRPYKKREFGEGESPRPYKKREDGAGDARPFKKRDEGTGDARAFKKRLDGDSRDAKPYKKRAADDAEGGRPYKKRADGDDGPRPFKKRSAEGDGPRPFGKAVAARGDKPRAFGEEFKPRTPLAKRFGGEAKPARKFDKKSDAGGEAKSGGKFYDRFKASGGFKKKK